MGTDTGIRGGSAVAGLLLVLALLMTGLVTDHARAAEEVTPRDKMLALTNQDRKQHDKRVLRLNARLSRYAARHSEDMEETGLVHTPIKALVKKVEALGIDWSAIGENIGTGPSLRSVQEAFMDSTDHRKNILNSQYDHAATGVFESDGSVWVTVIFYG